MGIKQKQAVVNAVTEVLGDVFVPKVTEVKSLLTKEQLHEVRSIVADGILSDNVLYSKSKSNVDEIKKYVNGMVNNHLRKSKELNGGVVHKSSSKSNRDPSLTALKTLKKSYAVGSSEYVSVAEAITKREAELLAAKKAAVKPSLIPNEILQKLPEDLQEEINNV
jgi:hypothetical protein